MEIQIKPIELTVENIAKAESTELLEMALHLYDIKDETERTYLRGFIEMRGGKLGCAPLVKRTLNQYERQNKKLQLQYQVNYDGEGREIQLARDGKGVPLATMDNILTIMQRDPFYDGIQYNLLTNCAEIHQDFTVRRWSDTDEAESMHYLEREYGIYAERKHTDALRIFFREREYNPILDMVKALEWDGTERCEHFLTEWAKAEDTPYTREVSRLIFAGGINRLFLPGCKFDDVPILIGTNQGEGKSTLVKWLAINDTYFAEVTEMDGQRGIEQLEGAWICEIAELLALTKTKEQEAVKSYITRQRDKYRKPYDKQVSEYPRRCVFIGTTNNRQFLKDKTGNRRFYPVEVHSNGYFLYEHEAECREYILQCWAEASEKYRKGQMPNYANRALLDDFKAAQEAAMEDDWRVGAIEKYLDAQPLGSLVCVRQLKREALTMGDFAQDPTAKESQEIGVIMNKFSNWERCDKPQYTPNYGRQRCWRRVGEINISAENADELPY